FLVVSSRPGAARVRYNGEASRRGPAVDEIIEKEGGGDFVSRQPLRGSKLIQVSFSGKSGETGGMGIIAGRSGANRPDRECAPSCLGPGSARLPRIDSPGGLRFPVPGRDNFRCPGGSC